MRKIRNITRDERLNFRKLLPLFLLIFATLSPLRVARAGIIQDVINGLIDGFHAGVCLIDVGDEYCKADLVYFPRGNYDRSFTVSSHIEDNIKMEKKKIFFGVWTYYVGKGKVEYKTTRFDLNNSDGKPVAKIHAYAIPTPSFLVMESWKNESGTAGFTEEVSPYTSNFSVKDCKMQTGNNSCVATVTIKVPNSFKKDMVLKTEDGKVIEMQRDGILNYLNIFVKRFVGYGPTKHPASTFILYDNKGRVMNAGVAKVSCQDKKATINDEGYCVIEKETEEKEKENEDQDDHVVVTGNNESIVYNASPNPCMIKEGKSSCDVLFKWDLTNLVHNYNTRMTSSYIEIYKMISGVEVGNKEMIKKSFSSSKPYGSSSLAVPYPGGSYAFSIRHQGKTETLDSLVVRAECGPETKWDGKKCVRYETKGEIKPEFSHCEINDGSSGCSVELTWNTIDPDPSKKSKVMAGSKVIAEENMGSETVVVSYPYSVYNLEHKGKSLGTAYANSYCKAGAIWDGNKCERKVDPEEDDLNDDKENPGDPGPDPDWSKPVCEECDSQICSSKWDAEQNIKCTQKLGGGEEREFYYNCCVGHND